MFDEAVQTEVLKRHPFPSGPSYPSPAAVPQVRIATTETKKEEIYRLRYKVYIEEMRGQNRHTEADNQKQQLRDHWDDRAYHFYVEQDGVVVACARLNLRRDGPFECEEQFDTERFKPAFPRHVCMISRLALHPDLRGSYVLKQLTCSLYGFMLEEEMRFNFIDCHPQLLPLYSRLGFRVYRAGFNHDKYTYVIPMVLDLDDIDHLKRMKSPLVSVAEHFGYPATRDPQSCPSSNAAAARSPVADADTFWDLLRDRLMEPTTAMEGFDLLTGLTLDETKMLIALGHIISCRAGDSVLNPGDPGREIFLILTGSFQVQRWSSGLAGHELKVMKILATGETFGEMRFLREELRYTSVKAREDSILLVLNAKVLDRLVMTEPRVAAKIFRNLACIVATRLCDSVRFARFSRRHTTSGSTPVE